MQCIVWFSSVALLLLLCTDASNGGALAQAAVGLTFWFCSCAQGINRSSERRPETSATSHTRVVVVKEIYDTEFHRWWSNPSPRQGLVDD